MHILNEFDETITFGESGRWSMRSRKNRTDDEITSHLFGKKLHMLAEKAKYLRDISRAEAKRLGDLWNGGQNKIVGPDGKIKYTRGLGYKLDDATCFEGSFGEHHSYQIRESCCMIVIKTLEGAKMDENKARRKCRGRNEETYRRGLHTGRENTRMGDQYCPD
jgi:hypothetical protein